MMHHSVINDQVRNSLCCCKVNSLIQFKCELAFASHLTGKIKSTGKLWTFIASSYSLCVSVSDVLLVSVLTEMESQKLPVFARF